MHNHSPQSPPPSSRSPSRTSPNAAPSTGCRRPSPTSYLPTNTYIPRPRSRTPSRSSRFTRTPPTRPRLSSSHPSPLLLLGLPHSLLPPPPLLLRPSLNLLRPPRLLTLHVLQIPRRTLPTRIQYQALIMFRLTQYPRPSRQQRARALHRPVHCAHVVLRFGKTGSYVLDHAVDFLHAGELGAETGIARFSMGLGACALLLLRGGGRVGSRGVFLSCCAARRAGEEVFCIVFSIFEVQFANVRCFCGLGSGHCTGRVCTPNASFNVCRTCYLASCCPGRRLQAESVYMRCGVTCRMCGRLGWSTRVGGSQNSHRDSQRPAISDLARRSWTSLLIQQLTYTHEITVSHTAHTYA